MTNSAVMVGPSSRTRASDTASPVKAVMPKRWNCEAVFSTSTLPMESEAARMIGSEPTPTKSICSRVSDQ